MPVKEEQIDLPEGARCCPHCQLPFTEFPTTEDSELLEINVRPYKRRIKLKRYTANCRCQETPKFITTPAVGRLIPGGKIGVSLWVKILLDKFEYYCPTYRLLKELKNLGADIPQGTVTGGLKKMVPFFKPIYEAIKIYNRNDEHLWNADETRWGVFAAQEGKTGNRWYLWVFAGLKSVAFFIDPTRSKIVPQKHLGKSKGKIVVDRYKGYFVLKSNGDMTLIFCWAHVRRDFLTHAKKYPTEESGGLGWAADIGNLYYLNAQRLSTLNPKNEVVYQRTQTELENAFNTFYEKSRIQQADPDLCKEKRKILGSLDYHRFGLEPFVQDSTIPMDNNRGERILRGPVVGRKAFYGSGSLWSAQLMAMLFSLLQTLKLWNINPHQWMTWFLLACANNGGQLPKNWERFLPWNMHEEQLKSFSKPIAHSDTS